MIKNPLNYNKKQAIITMQLKMKFQWTKKAKKHQKEKIKKKEKEEQKEQKTSKTLT